MKAHPSLAGAEVGHDLILDDLIPAHILRKLVRDSVEALLPPDALKVAQVAERSERDFLLRLASKIGGGAA